MRWDDARAGESHAKEKVDYSKCNGGLRKETTRAPMESWCVTVEGAQGAREGSRGAGARKHIVGVRCEGGLPNVVGKKLGKEWRMRGKRCVPSEWATGDEEL